MAKFLIYMTHGAVYGIMGHGLDKEHLISLAFIFAMDICHMFYNKKS